MKNKKGFTLVELVIVIAVIAILAGVMIGTFASVVKKAKDSAKAQEMAAAKQEQTANDVIEKLNNSNWLGWEDFEEKLATRLTKAYQDSTAKVPVDALQDAVKGAMAAYYANAQLENTGLTEQQVKTIINDAFAKVSFTGVSAEQVKAIVNAAVSGTSTLTKSQVQAIVDAAQAKNLSLAQVTKAIADATKNFSTTDDINKANAQIVAAIENLDKKASTLTAKQVEEIMKAVTWQGGGVTTWFDAATYDSAKEYTLTKPEEVAGLATLVNGGYNFEGKTITLKPADKETTIKVDASNWTPIGNTRGSEFKGTISGGKNGVVIEGLTLNEQFNAVKNGYLINCSSTGHMDKVGVGFVAYLGEGATLSNIVFEDVNVNIVDTKMDGICFGVAVGYLDGGTIENVTIRKSSTEGATNKISTVYRTGGLVGAAAKGTIKNVEISNLTVQSKGWKELEADDGHCVAGALIGYARDFADDTYQKLKVSISGVTYNNVEVQVRSIAAVKDQLKSGTEIAYYSIVGARDNVTGGKATIEDLSSFTGEHEVEGVKVVEKPNEYVK